MSELDGKNIFQWRAEFSDLEQRFIEYARHNEHCGSNEHREKHRDMGLIRCGDSRAVCEAGPCTCGVLIILGVMLAQTHPRLSYPCPDKVHVVKPDEVDIRLDATQPPTTLWGLPVVTSDDVTPGHIQIRDANSRQHGMLWEGKPNDPLGIEDAKRLGLLEVNRRKLHWPDVNVPKLAQNEQDAEHQEGVHSRDGGDE